MKNSFLTFLFVIFSNYCVFAQNVKAFIDEQKSTPIEKVYLNTDRDAYFVNDTLWFAAHLLDGESHAPLQQDCNLYLEVFNDSAKVVAKHLYDYRNGFCPGYISFSETDYKEGKYLLRAYTDFLKPLGEDFFFTKGISIKDVKNQNVQGEQIVKTKARTAFIDFYPEGGFMLKDKINQVAFAAHDGAGKPLHVSGVIENAEGKEIARIETTYEGRGRCFFIPRSDKYKVKLFSYENTEYNFPKVKQKGSKLMLRSINDKVVNLNVLSNNAQKDAPYYIAVFYRGEGRHSLKVEESHLEKTVQIETRYLGDGINRMVLLNRKMEPVSERLVFVDKNNSENLEIAVNNPELSTRTKLGVYITALEEIPEKDWANLSVKVVNENSLNATGIQQNIKSYLFLDSELRGNIANPADYFIDGEKVMASEKQELLMLTNGWRNYIWTGLKEQVDLNEATAQLGLQISGKVKRISSKKVFSNTPVHLNVLDNEMSWLETTNTNGEGDFTFSNVQFYDSVAIIVQGLNYRDKPNTLLSLSSYQFPEAGISKNQLLQLNQLSDITVAMQRTQYLNDLRLQEYKAEPEVLLLDEIEVKGDRMVENDGHKRIYSMPDISVKVDDADFMYRDIFHYMSGRFPGVYVVDGRIVCRTFRSAKTSTIEVDGIPMETRTFGSSGKQCALYLVDGMIVDAQFFGSIPMSLVDKVEVLKGPSAAIYGSRGASGVISILTKHNVDVPYTPKYDPGTIIKKVKGFSKYREFYSPVYTSENINSPLPDYRTTLYWNPKVVLKNERTSHVSFFTCDNLANYRVFVEGVSTTGKLFLGTGSFTVNERVQ